MDNIRCKKCATLKNISKFQCLDHLKKYYRKTCNDCRTKAYDLWYEKNKELVIKKRMERYYADHENQKQELRDSYLAHKSSRKISQKKYYSENYQKISEYISKYWADPKNNKRRKMNRKFRYETDMKYKLTRLIRTRISNSLKSTKPSSSITVLGCTVTELIKSLESKFQPGMTWENHGEWHIDHIDPISSFDLSKLDEFLKACHYTNLQPLWAIDNLRKGSKIVR